MNRDLAAGRSQRGTPPQTRPLIDDQIPVGYKPTVTEPRGPATSTASSPTPEEITARLEALLKRTHELRAQQSSAPAGNPLSVTWPPPARELDRYDVVDVPEQSRAEAHEDAETVAVARVPRPVVPAQPDPVVPPTDPGRPDWSELLLRTPPEDAPRAPAWGWLLTLVLGLATVGQAGYIWYWQPASVVVAPGRIRVDGPEGADVRIAGRSIGAAPLEHSLDAGDYDVELVDKGRVVRADRVSVGVGRTVVLLAPLLPDAAVIGGPAGAGATPTVAAGTTPVPTRPTLQADLVSETTGAVTIESAPPGQRVTMGGRPRGVTPLTLGKIPPGRHDVLVGSTARHVDVKAGQVATLRVPR